MFRTLLLSILTLAAGVTPGPPAVADGAAELRLVDTTPLDARMTDYAFRTPALPGEVHIRVMLPASAAADPRRRYPVLYLLHGSDGDWRAWTDQGHAERLTEGFDAIVVMPDGGAEGWYTDWAPSSSGDSRGAWERFHLGELVPWVDAHLPTIAQRSARAVAGLSMGGFGALSYAARRPDLFVAAASFSGAVDLGTPAGSAPDVVDAEPWGPWTAADAVTWRAHNPADLAANLRGLALTLRAGNGDAGGPLGGGDDPLERTLHAQNDSMATRLRRLRIPVTYDDYGAGAHDWPYWERDLARTLPSLTATFARPPALPARFDYISGEQTFTIRGYRVTSTAPPVALRSLRSVGAGGFMLEGGGPTVVTTAARYRRGGRYRVRVDAGGAVVVRVLRAGRDGRLVIAVPGSGHVGISPVRTSS